MLIDVGDVLPSFGFTVTSNGTGLLAAPASFDVALTAPDGTTPAVTVVNPSTGVYAVTHVATQAGRYVAVGTAAGNGCDGASSLTWDVAASTVEATAAVSLQDLRTHLGVGTSTTDEQLRKVALVATELAEAHTGRTYRRRTVTETHDGGLAAVLLRETPVASVSTVTVDGAPVTDYRLDVAAGILYRTSSGCGWWPDGRANVVVTYAAGATAVPARVQHGILELARHLWDTQRGGSQLPRQAGAGDEWDPRAGFSIPRRVAELLDVDRDYGIG